MKPDIGLVREIAPTGRLRAAINLGNPVLAHSRTSAERPAGVTIDLARALGAQLGVPVDLLPFDTPGGSWAAMAGGRADIGFLAVDPERAEMLRFTSPYVRIEGCYLVRENSPITTGAQVDVRGRRVVVGVRSAYGLFLARHLKQAQLLEVPTSEGVVDALAADPSLDVAAGVRQQMAADARRVPGMRLLPDAFMSIYQAMAMPRARAESAHALLEAFIATARGSGRVAAALASHGIEGAEALP